MIVAIDGPIAAIIGNVFLMIPHTHLVTGEVSTDEKRKAWAAIDSEGTVQQSATYIPSYLQNYLLCHMHELELALFVTSAVYTASSVAVGAAGGDVGG